MSLCTVLAKDVRSSPFRTVLIIYLKRSPDIVIFIFTFLFRDVGSIDSSFLIRERKMRVNLNLIIELSSTL